MSPEQKKIAVELLIRARDRHLAREAHHLQGRSPHICHAITYAAKAGEGVVAWQLRNTVGRRLLPYTTLEDWLQASYGIDASNDFPKLQRTRVAWINSLIEELS